MDVVETAQRLADEALFPAALATDAAETVPVELLDALADAGLYGLAGPAAAGGLDADFETVCAVVEALASGCLTTAFVWVQHLGAVLAVASSDNAALRDEWLEPLCRGERRPGLALGGSIPGRARLVARETGDGWTFDGSSPFISGWGRIDVVHTAARAEDGRLVWALVDAAESATLTVERLELVALNATATVQAALRDHPVPAERVTSVSPFHEGPTPPQVLRIHASLALGVAVRCCRLLVPWAFDHQVTACRAELVRLEPATIETARASAGELAFRAAAALTVSRGSRSLLLADHAQLLVRDALFVLVYALRPGSRDALLDRLGTA
jgi:alkylation response protein AidB-like acyl-CoA dehydrogenase